MLACFICGGVVELYLVGVVVSAVLAFINHKRNCKCKGRCKHE